MTIVAWALILLAIADWGATRALIQAARRVKEPSLEERATASVVLSFAATGAAILSAAFLAHVTLPDGLGTAVLVAVLMLISLPQLVWYAAWRNGRFS